MSEVLVAPQLLAAPQTLDAPPPTYDSVVAALLEQATTEAYQRGQRDGFAAAQHQVVEATGRLLEHVTRTAAELRLVAAQADVELALRIAEAVLGREPHDDGRALLDRVFEALAVMDEERVTLRANPGDLDVLREGLRTHAGAAVDIVPDATLAQGEAHLHGRWARADLSTEAAWAAVRGALGDLGTDAPAEAGSHA